MESVGMDINHLTPAQLREQALGRKDSPAREEPPQAPGAQDEQVSLSSNVTKLEAALQSARTEQFDQAKVDAIKAAIERGEYHIDPQRLARNFINLESQINR